MELTITPIGAIHTPFTDISGMPIQPAGAKGYKGTVRIFEDYVEGLKDLDGFSHITLLYYFHRVQNYRLTVTPFLDEEEHGVFATRAPKRPNPIGLSVVRLRSIEESTLYVENVDILDGSPLLDIKPYVPKFDQYTEARTGWLEKSGEEVERKRSDERFSK
mgnify:CR=1 FL=1